MARDRYEDEDDDDRPRKRRSRDEDDDQDDRPRRRRRSREPEKSGSNTGLILGIVLGGLLLIVVGCGIAGFFTFKKARDAFQVQDAADEASAAGMEFFEQLSSERTGQAYSSTTSTFRNSYPENAFADLLKKYPLLTKHITATEQGHGIKVFGTPPSRTYTTTIVLSDTDDFGEEVDEDGNPLKKQKPKKAKPAAKTLTVKIVIQEEPKDIWKVDSLVISP